MTLADLMEEAKAATPGLVPRVQRWRGLWPIYTQLRERGFTCERAVSWLAEKGQIMAGEERKALNAFFQIATRRNKKTAK